MSVVVPPTLLFGNQQHISQNSSYYGGKSYAAGDCVEGIEAEAEVLLSVGSVGDEKQQHTRWLPI